MLNQEGGIEPEQFRVEALIDRLDALGKAWLGLTINCCQCHDHKYDPLSQREYYQLFAFLNNDDEPFIEVPTPKQQSKRDEILAKVRDLEDKAMRQATNLAERLAAWEKEIADAAGDWTVLEPKEWLNFATKYENQGDGSLLAGGDVKPGAVTRVWVETALTDVLTNWPYAATTLALQQLAVPRETHIFKRGDWQRPGEKVGPDVPAVLHRFPEGGAPRNRLGLARWLVDARSPTTARVMVNRIWQAYFGQGLVTTPEDFGTRVEPPSHPELLDWLAREFMDEGWQIKAFHRLIVQSATYRQSSRVSRELPDPYNRLLGRGPRFRVEAEVVQDIALAASGLMNLKIGGPSVRPPIPASVGDTVYGGLSWPESTGEDRYRRGLYTFYKRSLPFPSLIAFDAPTAENACTRRVRSDTPLQALTTLNEKSFVEAAQAMGVRVLKEGGRDDRSRAGYAFRLCTGRAPTEREVRSILRFQGEQYKYFEDRSAAALAVAVPDIKNVPPDVNLHKVAAWAMVSRAILNLDETITKE